MGTISKPKRKLRLNAGSSQLRYASAYVLITAVVLLFLNIYAPMTIRSLVFRSQQTSMEDKAELMATALSAYETPDAATVKEVIESANDLHTTRVIVTDSAGYALYDSIAGNKATGKMILLPEVVEALKGNDVFHAVYDGSAMESQAAIPIMSYNKLTGALYLMEYDRDLGSLISTLETNLLWISASLELIVIIFSLIFSAAFSRRMRKIQESVRQMHDGNYDAKIEIRGHDEVAQLGRSFNELSDRLNQSESVRKQFVSNASHELKTPLASIKLLSDSILQNDMPPETVREFVTDIGSEADRLTRLSGKLLELTRLDSAPAQDEVMELTDVAQTAQRVLRMLQPLAESYHITLDCDCEAELKILSREDDLYQVLFNLAENGIKYNRENGRLRITAQKDSELVRITVEDTGIGIPEDARAHVFERFYRVDKARSRRAGGAGLGLAIVHDMVCRNEGTIKVSAAEEGGTCFTVTFPYFDMEEGTP